MNEKNSEDILNALYDMVQDARSMPLAADKCVLNREQVLDMLDDVLGSLPSEMKEAQAIVESRNTLVSQARREAETIVREAREKAEKMTTKEAIHQETKRKCQEMVLQAQTRMAELRKASNDYMDDALRRTEEAISNSLNDVKETHEKFKALSEAQEKRSAVTVQDNG